MTPDKLTALLGANRTVNMIQVSTSRTRARRDYRLFVVDSDLRVRDVTGIICRTIGQPWNSINGTYETKEPYRDQHASILAFRIKSALRLDTAPNINTL